MADAVDRSPVRNIHCQVDRERPDDGVLCTHFCTGRTILKPLQGADRHCDFQPTVQTLLVWPPDGSYRCLP